MAGGFDLAAYLRRIGHDGAVRADLATLRALHRLHPQAIAFENLDPLLRRPVRLDAGALQDKLVHGGRGGWCYEHNGLFAHALEAIGFELRACGARVLWNLPPDAVRPRTHMLLAVALDGRTWLADVGFGGLTLTAPLELMPGAVQATPHEPFRLIDEGDGDWRLEAEVAGDWRALYRFDLQRQRQPDHEMASWYLGNHPESPFVSRLIAARALADGRITLANGDYARHTTGGASERRTIATAAELRAVLADEFGIAVPRGDGVDERLAAVLAG